MLNIDRRFIFTRNPSDGGVQARKGDEGSIVSEGSDYKGRPIYHVILDKLGEADPLGNLFNAYAYPSDIELLD